MRFMMLMYPGPQAEAGAMPSAAQIQAMMQYNAALVDAGVLLAGDGLQPSALGARATFRDGVASITPGPFPGERLLGGYWMIKVASREEALSWLGKIPASDADMVELRQVFEPEDFGAEVAHEERELLERMARQR
ncbi:YciI family protein [Massilia sp. TS11]|uniref:YciI family protein n=1 Tax=Massilia sp. TS11 TaxID=2908003 RepID=UPI001EDB012B|nr:YciI family protein [Massilia sp. TS11]MCG2583281.1 YciI family protein [Massilia sp. TS11]